MPILQQEQYQKVAQLLSSGIHETFKHAGGKSVQFNTDLNTFSIQGKGNKTDRKFLDFYTLISKEIGYDLRVFQNLGVTAVYAIGGLRYLIQVGAITAREAEAFLVTKYPDAGFTGGSFNDVRVLPGYGGQDNEDKSEPAGSPDDEKSPVEKAREIQEVQQDVRGGALVPAVSPAGNLPIYLREVPDSIPEAEELQSVLEDFARQVQITISKVANGAINLQPNSIDGRVVRPGSLPYTALDPIDAQSALQEFPDADQAIILRITPDPVVDVWAEDGDTLQTASGIKYTGPRRVWRVSNVSVPPGFKPTLGPLRYRIVVDKMRLGIGSVRYKDPGIVTGNESHEIRYGIVIRGIPGFYGRPVSRILYCDNQSYSPSSLKYQDPGVTAPDVSPGALFEKTAETKFQTDPPTLYSSFADAAVGGDGAEIPDQTYLDNIDGMTFMLINGRTAEEVYAQLNSLPSVYNAHIGGRGAGPGESCPSGLDVTSLTTAGLVVASPGAPFSVAPRTLDGYTTTGSIPTTAFSLTGAAAAVTQEGVPFLMRDCERLRIQDGRFAVQVQVWPPRVSNWVTSSNGADNYGRHPSHWYTRGVDLDKKNDRQVAIDIVVV